MNSAILVTLNDPLTLNPYFKDSRYSSLNISETVQNTDVVTMEYHAIYRMEPCVGQRYYTLRSPYGMGRLSSVTFCAYPGGRNFRQYFCT